MVNGSMYHPGGQEMDNLLGLPSETDYVTTFGKLPESRSPAVGDRFRLIYELG